MQNTEKKQKKYPERKCLGCGISKEKTELLRVVRAPDATVSLDFTGRKPGRGAYLCKDLTCMKKAAKSKRLEHNLECQIPAELYSVLEKELSEHGET